MPALLSARTSRALLTAALLALLCGRTTPARADDPLADSSDSSDSGGQAYDPADANHDGTVTRKEARRYRRAHRHRDPSSAADAKADAQTEAGAEHSATASARAAGAAEALKNSLPSAGAGEGLKPGAQTGMSAAASAGGAAGAKASGDPADPKTPADFALAARSGYAPAFAAAGLKLGPDGRSIVRADGSPATAEDYARLRRGIQALPAALLRRPDFFAAVSPGHFNDLKRGYRENPELSASVYKHVGTTDADRDFVHTASCAKVSGDCNASVDKPSYKKGDFVAPEDLDRMWGALQKELDDASNPDGAGQAPRGGLKPLKAALAVDTESAEQKSTAGTAASASGAGVATVARTPAAAAAQAARRMWRATASALGLGGGPGDDPSSHALEFSALGAAALAALVFALRKRG